MTSLAVQDWFSCVFTVGRVLSYFNGVVFMFTSYVMYKFTSFTDFLHHFLFYIKVHDVVFRDNNSGDAGKV